MNYSTYELANGVWPSGLATPSERQAQALQATHSEPQRAAQLADLTNVQWEHARRLLPEAGPYRGCGRPLSDARAVLDGVLWVMRTGAGWSKLPPDYPPYQTCHRRYQRWQEDGSLRKVIECLYGAQGLVLYANLCNRSRRRGADNAQAQG